LAQFISGASSISLAGLIAVRRSQNEASRQHRHARCRNDQGRRAGTAKVESWFSSIRLLRDAVVVEVLGVLSNCPASDAEPTML
jgi:hypothetical protein